MLLFKLNHKWFEFPLEEASHGEQLSVIGKRCEI